MLLLLENDNGVDSEYSKRRREKEYLPISRELDWQVKPVVEIENG